MSRALFQAHATRLRNAAWALMHQTDYFDREPPRGADVLGARRLTRRERTRLNTLRVETEALATLLRAVTPNDRSWRHYDEDMRDLEDYLHDTRDLSGYATGKLHSMLDMVSGAASRAPHDITPWPFVVTELAGLAMARGRSDSERAEARAVLGDALEEMGRGDVATLLRLERARVDHFLFPFLRGEGLAARPRLRRRR